ncbi:MAG TPA: acyl-CoA dehydrogenase family protein, partial [Gemmatimonadaceae bacterium]|nr:acyl-CoA dehydrogenase family protein [Gemmatimonadaceae bacterium]
DQSVSPNAALVDQERAFPDDSIAALGRAGLLGLAVPAASGGMGEGLRTAAAVLDEVAQRCSSTAMVYLMHICGVACYAAAPDKTASLLRAAAAGTHLSTLAFSERGSRSHFWAPVSRAEASNGGARLNAQKSFVTSAGHADGYVVSTLAANGTTPVASTIYLVLRSDRGVTTAGTWDGLGMRGNASAPMTFADVTVAADRALSPPGQGLEMMLAVVLPAFQIGTAAVALGIAEAAVQATAKHLTSSRLEHLNSALADLPTLRARLGQMRIATDCARAHLTCVLDSIEAPGPATQLLVLEAKAAATEAAVEVTELALRTCGGAAFAGAHGIERMYRDARAPIVMAPTTDQVHDFIGRALCGMEVF